MWTLQRISFNIKEGRSRCAVIKPFQVSNCNMASTAIYTATFVTQKILLDFSRRGYMFWSDVTADTISRAKLDGSEVTVLVNFGLSTVGKSGRSPKQLYSLQYNVFTKHVPTYECIHKNT